MPTSIHELVATNRYQEVQKLLEKHPELVNQSAASPGISNAKLYAKEDSPLMIATRKESKELIKLLLDRGADPNQGSANGNREGGDRGASPLLYACLQGLDKILDIIVTDSMVPLNLDTTANHRIMIANKHCIVFNATPLLMACARNDITIVKILLRRQDVNVNHISTYAEQEKFQETMAGVMATLPPTAQNERQQILENIVEHLPQVTPLAFSAMLGYQAIVKELLGQPKINLNQLLKPHQFFNSNALTEIIASPFIDEEKRINLMELFITKGADFQKEIGGNSPVCAAAMHNRHQLLQRLIEKGAAFDQTLEEGGMRGGTPLTIACVRTNVECVELLLKNGANPNYKLYEYKNNELSWITTPLLIAIEKKPNSDDSSIKNQALMVLKLLLNGADVYFIFDIPEYQGYNALCHAVEVDNPQVVKILFGYMKTHPHEKRDFIVSLALTHAALYATYDIFKLLLDFIGNPNLAVMEGANANELGVFPLLAACNRGEEAIVKLLLAQGADVNQVVTVGGNQDLTPIMLAVAKGHQTITELLVQAKVNIVIKTDHEHCRDHNPLSLATLHKEDKLLDYLLQNYPGILTTGNLPGIPPLMIAVTTKNSAAVKLLLQHGADPNTPFRYEEFADETPLSLAIQRGDPAIAEILLKAGANANALISYGECKNISPITAAILENNAALTKILLQYGADPYLSCEEDKLSRSNGLQIAMIVCETDHRADVLLTLLDKLLTAEEKTAFTKHINKEKLSTAFAAILLGNLALIDTCLSQQPKAIINTYLNKKLLLGPYKGETPLAAAAYRGNVEILRKLMGYDCQWQQIIHSQRIPGRTIWQIVDEHVTDETFKQMLCLTLKKDIFSKAPPGVTEPPADVIIPTEQSVAIKIKKKSADLGEMIYQLTYNHARKTKQGFYLYHARQDIEALITLFKNYAPEETANFDSLEACLMTNLITEHILRTLQALVEYNRDTFDERSPLNQACWGIRNILMHDFYLLALPSLISLASILIAELPPLLDKETQLKPIKLVLSLSRRQIPNNQKTDAGSMLTLALKKWLADYQFADANSLEALNEFQVICDEIEKINLLKEPVANTQNFYVANKYINAMRASEVRIGSMYQNICRNEQLSNLLTQPGLITRLEECRLVRDIVGHEYSKEKISLADQIDPNNIYTIAKNITASGVQKAFQKLAASYDEIIKQPSANPLVTGLSHQHHDPDNNSRLNQETTSDNAAALSLTMM